MRKMSRRDTQTHSMSAYHRSAVQLFNGAGSGKIRKQCCTSLALDGVPHPQALVIDAEPEIGNGEQSGVLLLAQHDAQALYTRDHGVDHVFPATIGYREAIHAASHYCINLLSLSN